MATATALLGAIANDINNTTNTDNSQNAGGATGAARDFGQTFGTNIQGTGNVFTFDETSPAALAALTAAVSSGYSAVSSTAGGAVDMANRLASKALDTAERTLTPASEQGANFASKLIWPVVILVSLLAIVGIWFFGAARRKKEDKPAKKKESKKPAAAAAAAEGGAA